MLPPVITATLPSSFFICRYLPVKQSPVYRFSVTNLTVVLFFRTRGTAGSELTSTQYEPQLWPYGTPCTTSTMVNRCRSNTFGLGCLEDRWYLS
jgi:hypothetical protein